MTTNSDTIPPQPTAGPPAGRDIWLWGAGGHCVSVHETAVAAGWRLAGIIDPFATDTQFLGVPVYKVAPFAADLGFDAAVAIGDNRIRARVFAEIRRDHPGARLPVLCHPTAAVAHTALLSDALSAGTVVLQNATVGAAVRIGTGCVINTVSSLDHECVMGDFSSLAPGAILGGRVSVGARAFIGLGARVLQGRRIADDVVVGAGSLVNRDLDRAGGYWGTPARFQKSPEDISGFLSR